MQVEKFDATSSFLKSVADIINIRGPKGYAFIINGPQGCGKSFLMLILKTLTGPHFVSDTNAKTLAGTAGEFTGAIRDKVAVCVEEAALKDERVVNALRDLITAHTRQQRLLYKDTE